MKIMKVTAINIMMMLTSTAAYAFVFPAASSFLHIPSSKKSFSLHRRTLMHATSLQSQINDNTSRAPWPYISEDHPQALDDETLIEIEIDIDIPLTLRLPNTKDPYRLFNLQRSPSKKEIKRAYRNLACSYHPDARITSASTKDEKKNANDDFARINAAYAELLRDLEARTLKKNSILYGQWADWEAERERDAPMSSWTPPGVGNDDEEGFYFRRQYINKDDETCWHAASGEGGTGHLWIN